MLQLLKSAVVATALVAGAAQAVVSVTIEAPTIESTTSTGVLGVESFNGATAGLQSLVTTFGGSTVTGSFSGINILTADQFGGAGGTGNYAAVLSGNSSTLTFTGAPVSFVGFFASSIDSGSSIQVFSGSSLVYSKAMPLVPVTAGHFGNPDAPFAGQNATQAYAFFTLTSSTPITSIIFTQAAGGGNFEFDNLTVGNVPEPASWALMMAGFAMVGFSMRRRVRAVAA